MHDKIVIIGANDFQNQLILKAKNMGYETHVFAWEDGAVGKDSADYFYPLSITEKEKILEISKTISPQAVASIASDLAAITVNYVGSGLGLPSYNDAQCVECSTNKFKMRQVFKRAGIPTPGFFVISSPDSVDSADLSYPLIVKPTDRSGSRAITKLLSPEGLKEAVGSAIENSFEKRAIIEEYIDGDEFSCECISLNGRHHFLAVTKKYTTDAPHYIETGHMEPSMLSKALEEKAVGVIFAALDAIGVRFGASHSEFKVKENGDIRLIEIGARMGGDCIGSDLVQISTGFDFMRMVIDVAAGKEPSFEKINSPRIAIIRFIFCQDDLDRMERIKKHFPSAFHRISAMEPVNMRKIVDSSTRLGYYIVAVEHKEEADELLSI